MFVSEPAQAIARADLSGRSWLCLQLRDFLLHEQTTRATFFLSWRKPNSWWPESATSKTQPELASGHKVALRKARKARKAEEEEDDANNTEQKCALRLLQDWSVNYYRANQEVGRWLDLFHAFS